MRRALLVGLLCGGLAACALPTPFPPPPPGYPAPRGDLNADRQACNRAYPPGIGNYGPHAACVNAAVERDAIPTARYPDLVRLQEQLRAKYSAEIDRGMISPGTGEHKMREVDQMVAAATRERDAGRAQAADNHAGRLAAMLQQ
jgi:hypothetical protein